MISEGGMKFIYHPLFVDLAVWLLAIALVILAIMIAVTLWRWVGKKVAQSRFERFAKTTNSKFDWNDWWIWNGYRFKRAGPLAIWIREDLSFLHVHV